MRHKRKVGRPTELSLIQHEGPGRPVVYGAHSKKAILTHANFLERKLYDQIYADEPHLTDTDSILVQGLAIHLAMIKAYRKLFKEQGLVDEQGRLTDAHRVFYTCWKNVIKLCTELGLSSSTKMKLGIDWKKFAREDIITKYSKEKE